MPVLTAQSLSKRYARNNEAARRRGLTAFWQEVSGARRRDEVLRETEFWALRQVSLEVFAGEALGVMGLNGAGKSTLLRILAGLAKPDDGEVELSGRATALLDPMGGFDPMLTGRENVNGSPVLWDVDREQLKEVASEVMAFADLGDFIDAPVRTYSKGMRMRLAFAIVANATADIVFIDEALGVGDIAFQRKCVEFLRRFTSDGGALVLVSHSIWALEALCDRGLLLESGRVTALGPIMSVTDRYSQVHIEREAHEGQPLPVARGASNKAPVQAGTAVDGLEILPEELPEVAASSTGDPPKDELLGPTHGRPIGFVGFELFDEAGGPPVSGSSMHVRISFRADQADSPVNWGLAFYSVDGQVAIAGALSPEESSSSIKEGLGTLELVVQDLPLSAGRYTARAAVIDSVTQVPLGLHGFDTPATHFEVTGSSATLVLDGLPRVQTALHCTNSGWWVTPAD